MSITVPWTSIPSPPPLSASSCMGIVFVLMSFFEISFLSSFLTSEFSSKVSCGIPFHVFTYPPDIFKTSSFFILKSCQEVNCALPVSSAIIPEKTFF